MTNPHSSLLISEVPESLKPEEGHLERFLLAIAFLGYL